MAERELEGKHVGFLLTDGVEEIEYTTPRDLLQEQGARTSLISPKAKGERVQGFNHLTPDETFTVDMAVGDVAPEQFDALVIPGGVANPDLMRLSEDAVDFVRAFADTGKPLAVICHGPWMLVEAERVRGRRLTSWPSLSADIRNAGGEWVDQPVVLDGNLITSRKPDDLDAFVAAVSRALAG